MLVENPHAFWQAINSSAIDQSAFIATFGYGLSRQGNDYGNQLAALLEVMIPLRGAVCAGSPPYVDELLRHPRISFWGDLDIEGLRIFERIKRRIHQLTLSALYLPMLASVKDSTCSHPYAEVAMKHRQSRYNSGEFATDSLHLIEACQDRAVDQEIVTVDEIIRYAHLSLTADEK